MLKGISKGFPSLAILFPTFPIRIKLFSYINFYSSNCPAMTIAVDFGRKATKQTNKQNKPYGQNKSVIKPAGLDT